MSATLEQLAIEMAEMRAETRINGTHTTRALEDIDKSLAILVQLQSTQAALTVDISDLHSHATDHEARIRSVEKRGATIDGAIVIFAAAWPFLARKLGLM